MAIDEILAEVMEKEIDHQIEQQIEASDIACELRSFSEKYYFDESY